MIGRIGSNTSFFRRHSGILLVEIIVATFIFVLIIGIAAAVFVRSAKMGRRVRGEQAALENARQAVEEMAREIRTGADPEVYDADCLSQSIPGEGSCIIFSGTSSQTKFSFEEKVRYYLEKGKGLDQKIRLMRREESASKGSMVSFAAVNTLSFFIPSTSPPRVTIFLSVDSGDGETVDLQTTVAVRSL